MNGTCLLKEERETLAMILRQEGQLSRSQGMRKARGRLASQSGDAEN